MNLVLNISLVKTLLEKIYDLKTEIHTFFLITNNKLTYAKSNKFPKKELDIYFENYRKDKFLKSNYIVYINNFLKYATNFISTESKSDYDKLIIYLDHLIYIHYSSIEVNKSGISNAILHYSNEGIAFVNHLDLIEIKDIYNILYSEWLDE